MTGVVKAAGMGGRGHRGPGSSNRKQACLGPRVVVPLGRPSRRGLVASGRGLHSQLSSLYFLKCLPGYMKAFVSSPILSSPPVA